MLPYNVPFGVKKGNYDVISDTYFHRPNKKTVLRVFGIMKSKYGLDAIGVYLLGEHKFLFKRDVRVVYANGGKKRI